MLERAHRVGLGRALGRVLIALGALRLEPADADRATAPSANGGESLPIGGQGPALEVYTFVTDADEYGAMRSSFAAGGFEPPAVVFTELDDGRAGGDRSDPFAAIASLGERERSAVVVLCHQDLRLDQGHGIAQLLARIAELDALDERWAVAGNAGVTAGLKLVKRLVDPYGGPTPGPLPAQAMSLDENFLVFNLRRPAQPSPSLSGFHFYGTDVCLNALDDGDRAYVIDFPLTHLSGGRRDDDYRDRRRRFLEAWNRRWLFKFVGTPNGVLFLSRSAILRRLFGARRVRNWVAAASGLAAERARPTT